MADPTYQRLTRARVNQRFALVTATRVSLWLANDHLLYVQHSGFNDIYKRFYFRDIQAITVQETNWRRTWNFILLVPVAICLVGIIISALPATNSIAMFVWAVFAAIFLLPMAINNLRGTACICQLRTAVQTESLGSLSRVRQTRKILERIHPLIVAAQGRLTAEEVSARMHETVSGGAVSPQPETPPPANPPVV